MFRLIDIFPSHFSFHSAIRINEDSKKVHICKLNKIIFQVLMDFKILVVVLDASIKI